MMNAHHHSQPTGGASDAAAALKGASLAFNKTKPKPVPAPKPITTRGVPGSGASLVAASAASHNRSRSTSPIQRQHTGTSTATSTPGGAFGRDSTADMRDRLSNFLASSPSAASHASHLSPHTRLDPKSPSYIAATLAASRSGSPSPQPQHPSPAGLTPAQLNQLHQLQESARRARRDSAEEGSIADSLDFPDTTSIPATGHLINMFERVEDVDPVKRSGDVKPRHPKPRPLTPEREMSPSRAKAARMGIDSGAEKREKPAAARQTKPKPRPITPTPVVKREYEEAVTPQAKKPPKPKKLRPVTPVAASERQSTEAITPQAKRPASRAEKPPVSPAKKPVHKRSAPEMQARKLQQEVKVRPIAEAPVLRSGSHLTRVPITETITEPKMPPAAPEPRRSRPKPEQAPPTSPVISRSKTEVVSPKPKRLASKAKLRPPTPPQPRGTNGKPKVLEAPPLINPRSMASVYDSGPLQEPLFPRPESAPRPSTADTSSSNDTFVSASSNQTAVPDVTPVRPPPRQNRSALSTPARSSANSSPTRMTPRRTPGTPGSSTTSLQLNSLSNAIMAGSLAAARLTPSNTGNSALSPPALPSRTKSPRLRQTLRQPPSKSDDEGEIRKKKHQRASNKHSHREGARQRWRDEITLRERRRYEGVWASNRGLLLAAGQVLQNGGVSSAPPDAGDCVANVVVREIWRRSRLPQEELGEVWDLVDRSRRGMLTKQEFVVGTWLVDQRLRGRKIPHKVGASVWDSAQGVKVLSPKAKK